MTSKHHSADYVAAWTLDQLAKSAFFHRKLHEWKLLDIAVQIEQVQGENLNWDELNISDRAWNKIIHRGIKPVVVFAHPLVLKTVHGSVGYYRMLAMVSQKSMKRIGINTDSYEAGRPLLDEEKCALIGRHLNRIISALVEADERIDAREFDLWRGMAAGSQAQGSWQNDKGALVEASVHKVILQRLQDRRLITSEVGSYSRIDLGAGRTLVFSDEPDIAVYLNHLPQVAVEVKGGIDPAGVLERIGAALKSLQRVRQENPNAITVLILQDVSITERAKQDLNISTNTVTYLFNTQAVLDKGTKQEEFFGVLGV